MQYSCALLCLCLSLAAVPAMESQEHKTPSKVAVRATLNDSFAKAGLRALKAIGGETGSFELMDGGGMGVPRETQEMIDSSDAEARTKKETALVAVLNELYLFHLRITFKQQHDYHVWKNKKDSYRATDMDAVVRAADHATNDPDVLKAEQETVALKSRERTCSNALEAIFRSRTYVNSPVECINLSTLAMP